MSGEEVEIRVTLSRFRHMLDHVVIVVVCLGTCNNELPQAGIDSSTRYM